MRLAWFLIVGGLAASVHFFTVVILVSLAHWPPALANVPAYALALTASYWGQSRLTFQVSKDTPRQALRFAATSMGGFVLNCTAYASLLRWSRLDYRLALGVVIAGVAVLSFVSMRRWVFAAALAADP